MGQFYTNLKLVPSPAGSIAPSTFVTIDSTQGNNMCRQATGSGDMPIAISQVGYDIAPGIQQLFPGQSINMYAADPGVPLQLFTDEDVAPLTIGAGGCNPGDMLGVESGTGRGVRVTKGSGSWYGAIATSAANQGEVVDVYKKTGVA